MGTSKVLVASHLKRQGLSSLPSPTSTPEGLCRSGGPAASHCREWVVEAEVQQVQAGAVAGAASQSGHLCSVQPASPAAEVEVDSLCRSTEVCCSSQQLGTVLPALALTLLYVQALFPPITMACRLRRRSFSRFHPNFRSVLVHKVHTDIYYVCKYVVLTTLEDNNTVRIISSRSRNKPNH